jgi:hypothetical protein
MPNLISKGLKTPRLTSHDIDKIASNSTPQFYNFPGTTLVVCALTLPNGYVIVGEAYAADPQTFDFAIGTKIALAKARNKIWELEGYLLQQTLWEAHLAQNGH